MRGLARVISAVLYLGVAQAAGAAASDVPDPMVSIGAIAGGALMIVLTAAGFGISVKSLLDERRCRHHRYRYRRRSRPEPRAAPALSASPSSKTTQARPTCFATAFALLFASAPPPHSPPSTLPALTSRACSRHPPTPSHFDTPAMTCGSACLE